MDDLLDLEAVEWANLAVLAALGGAWIVAVCVWFDIAGVEWIGVEMSANESKPSSDSS